MNIGKEMERVTAMALVTVGPAPRHNRNTPSSFTIRCKAWSAFLPHETNTHKLVFQDWNVHTTYSART